MFIIGSIMMGVSMLIMSVLFGVALIVVAVVVACLCGVDFATLCAV